MPTYQIGLQDGRKLRIEAESQDAALAGAQHFLQQESANTNPVADAVKSVPGGVLSGLASTLSAAGQAGALENFDPDMASSMPTPQQTQQALEKNVTGETYKPKTSLGRGAAELASTLGNPTSYIGPAGPLRAVASSLAANALSQGAGAVTNDSPVAKLLAAAAAPTFASKAGSVVPTAEELTKVGGAGMDAFRNSGLELKPAAMQNWALPTQAALDARGLDTDLAGTVHKVLDKYGNAAARADNITAPELTALRQKLGVIGRETNEGKATPQAAAAQSAMSALDEHIASLPQSQVAKGDLASSLGMWNDARQNYAAGMRANTIDEAAQKAADVAAGQNSGRNAGNKYRTTFASVVNNNKKMAGFTDAEENTIRDLAHGTFTQNALRTISNRLGGGGGIASTMIPLALGGAGAAAGGYEGGVEGGGLGAALAIAGMLARNRYNASVANSVEKMSQMVRSRSPLAQSRSVPATPSPAIQRFLNLARAVQASHASQSP